MWLNDLLKNLLPFFLGIVASWTASMFAVKNKALRKRLIIWGNITIVLIFLAVSVISFLTAPSIEPLQAEIAFYALHEKPDETYELYNLLGEAETSPKYLGLTDSLGHVKGLPIANSGDGIQIRVKLNRKGYLYIFHFDTTAMTLRQLFPTIEMAITNPLPAESWIELPSPEDVWTLDSKTSLEAFLIMANKSAREDIQISLNGFLERIKTEKTDRLSMIQKFEQELSALGSCFYLRSGELSHGLHSASPPLVKTRTFRGKEEKTLMLWQLVQHK
jgi:Domain of unknown function (DUF4384)